MARPKTVLDWINTTIQAAQQGVLTLEEWTRIRREGDPDEIAEAVERMEQAGGYDCLA